MTKNTERSNMLMRYAQRALMTIVALGALLALPAAATAAPVFGVEVNHTPKAVPFYGATPVAHGDQVFDYTVTFSNSGAPSVGIGVGDTLNCSQGTWSNAPSAYSYRWLRNGADIPSANTNSYTVVSADQGAALQCVVSAKNGTAGGDVSTGAQEKTGQSVNNAATVIPATPGGTAAVPPANTGLFTLGLSGTLTLGGAGGATLTCPVTGWTQTPTVGDFKWYRNGIEIGGATANTYVVTTGDLATPAAFQCSEVGTANGVSVFRGFSASRSTTTAPVPGMPAAATASAPVVSTAPPPAVTVALTLPPGLKLDPSADYTDAQRLSGAGWTCNNSTLTCTRTTAPSTGANAYPAITAHVNIGSSTADDLTASATISGGGAASPASDDETFTLAPERKFGAYDFTTKVSNSVGDDETRAGAHPYDATTSFKINGYIDGQGQYVPVQDPKTISLDLPPGFLGNPENAPKCKSYQAAAGTCPIESQVGVATTDVITSGPTTTGVYNIEPRKGYPAEFAFNASSLGVVHLFARVRSDGDYGLTIDTPYTTQARLKSASFTFWGMPADPTHDAERCAPGNVQCITKGASSTGDPTKPFLTNLTECRDEQPVTTLRTDSWQEPGDFESYTAASPLMTGCGDLTFDPTITVTPETTQADTPSGYDVHLGVPQTNDKDTLATPPLKDATVTLPLGVSLSPGTAEGLDGCTDAQLNLHSKAAATCPEASKIGEVHIATPVLPQNNDRDYIVGGVNYQLTGNIFLRKPDAGAKRETLYSIFLDIEDAQTGITVKLRGNVVPDETTGQLTARFVDNPQLPFTDFLLEFKGGDRAPLTNPMDCGPAKTTSTLSSWGGPTAEPSSTFNVDWDGQGGACPGTLPFTPTFTAGTVDPLAGAFSPFTMTINRADRQQIMSGVDVDMPSGLLGMIGSVPLCGEDQLAAGTCGDESQIGTTTVSAGAGNHPFSLTGKVFVGGPYKGQPFSLSIVVRAIAGPFDLGTVVVRAPIMVDAANAKLRVPADALPTILEGVPLRLKMINILLDRPSFIFNATNCNPQQVGANLSSLQGTVASVSSPYQPSGCEKLPFNPSFSATSDGRLKFKNGAALKVNITQQPGEAAIKSVAVTLPKQLPSRLIPTINNACVQAVFEENPANCPEDSYIGTTRATTPVFPDPMTGPVYVIARAKEVPQIVIILHGQGIAKGVDLKMYGDIIIDSGGGRSKSTFHMVPDVPISSFSLDLPAGPHSILDAPSYDVCQGPLKMGVNIVAQSGKRKDTNETVKVENCPKIPGPKVQKAWVTKKGIAVKTLVPSLGRLVVSGTGLTPVARKAVKRGIITANVPYTPAMRKAVQKGSKKLKVKVWFQPANAAKPSTKTITVKVKQRKAKK